MPDAGPKLARAAERRLRRQLERLRARDEPAPRNEYRLGRRDRSRAAGPRSAAIAITGTGIERVEHWFGAGGHTPFAFQRAVWRRYREGKSGLIHAATGTGKTLAAWLGPLIEWLDAGEARTPPLTVLWVTPMRALAADTAAALAESAAALGAPWTVGMRSGDTPSAERQRQDRRLPSALVTTPESLTLLLTRANHRELFAHLKMVVVDEWHELLGNKRGVQVELALARLRRIATDLRVWGLSATLGNLDDAEAHLLGSVGGERVAGGAAKSIAIDALIPASPERLPWAGHLGVRMVSEVAGEIERGGTTLVFTNTRSQAEIWYQALLDHRPDWAGELALHHGSLDIETRRWVEDGLRSGTLRAVVCTSSLDLGVDFSPVDRVLQIGSPKGVARLLQRAGRSGHRPDAVSRVVCVPTQALELVEAAAARAAASEQRIESRRAPDAPLDVLVQHLVTSALGGGFDPETLFTEVRSTCAYRNLSREQWEWALAFVTRGGVLAAYPEYRRVAADADGVHRVPDASIARRHRAQVGTIVSDASVTVQYANGAKIGSVEESFAARLNAGDCFVIGGRLVEFVRLREMTAWVRRARARRGVVPRWMGGKMPLSSELADAVRAQLEAARNGRLDVPELEAVQPLLALQARLSVIPAADELLVECHATREGYHLYFFPFAGRHAHAGMAALLAWRLAQRRPATFSMAANDYGFELLSPAAPDIEAALAEGLLSDADLLAQLSASLNAAELAKRHFREIARVAGLTFQGYPGGTRSARQLQVSSGLLWDVFARHDPDNLLLRQAEREVLERELDYSRLAAALQRMGTQRAVLTRPRRMTPFALPLMAERLRERLSTEDLATRVERLRWEMLAVESEAPRRRSLAR
jgi:ATP-dependent Lhr-like helicase